MAREEGATEKVKLVAAVLALEMLIAGFHVVSRAALNMGVSKMAFLVYRKDRPPLTLLLMAEFFMLAAVGTTFTQGFYILGLYYLSPTYVSAIQNSVPAITFVMAAALRIEQVNIKSGHGFAKIAGTVATIAGATIITLYKGMTLTRDSEGTHKLKDINVITSPGFTWIAGCLIMFLNCLCLSGWMVLQGIVVLGLAWYAMIWCITKGGPLFVSAFHPLQTVMVAILAAIFLGDRLYIGGVIGAVIIVGGLYCVLWAKGKETKSNSDLLAERSLARNLLHEESTYGSP